MIKQVSVKKLLFVTYLVCVFFLNKANNSMISKGDCTISLLLLLLLSHFSRVQLCVTP